MAQFILSLILLTSCASAPTGELRLYTEHPSRILKKGMREAERILNTDRCRREFQRRYGVRVGDLGFQEVRVFTTHILVKPPRWLDEESGLGDVDAFIYTFDPSVKGANICFDGGIYVQSHYVALPITPRDLGRALGHELFHEGQCLGGLELKPVGERESDADELTDYCFPYDYEFKTFVHIPMEDP